MATSGRRKSHDEEDEGDERRKSKLLRSRRAHGDRYIRSGRRFDAIYMGDSDSKSSTIQSEPLMPSSHRKLRKKKKKKRPATHLERHIDRQSDREWWFDEDEEEEEFLTNRSTDNAEEESAAPPNRGVPHNCQDAAAADGRDVFWDAAYRELQAELSSMRIATRDLQEKLSRQEALVKNERRVNEELHNHQIDMQYDLAETRKVRNRLERENNILRKKLVKRDIEYTQLEEKLQALEKIMNQQQEAEHQQQQGREPEESPEDEDDDEEEDDFHASKSLWGLLAEEVVVSDQQRERSLSPHKVRKPSIFDAFFSSSSATTTTTTAHMLSKSYSMRGSNNNNNWRNPSPEHERSLPSGGFIPAA